LKRFTQVPPVWAFALLLLPISAFARAVPEIAELAADPTWIKLVHYESGGSSLSGWRSAIHPGDFFAHPDGATDPVAELEATVAALNAAPTEDHDRHAQCRFPARLLWLKSKFKDSVTFRTDIECRSFSRWTHANDIDSISIVFAAGSLGNPATYYGHTLLKFNFGNTHAHTSLMDESVNYGAILEGTDDNQITYIFKSLTGGYDAGFSHINFYYHDHNYGGRELRDLWEYKLELSQKDVDLIVAHAWEVLGKRYTYYFFKGNCAYQMGKVLEVVDGLQVIPEDRPWTIPQSLIQHLSSVRFRDRLLVSEIKYHPSRQSRFYEKYRSLSQEEVQVFKSAALDIGSLGNEFFQQRPLSSRQAILDTLIDYERYAHNPLSEASPAVKQSYATALSLRYELPPGAPEVDQQIPKSPDHGRPAGWVQIGLGRHTSLGRSLSLQIRPAYYDALDGDSGHVRNGALAMGDFRADIFQDRIRVDWLDLIHIENVNPAISQLSGDRGTAWGLRIGAEQARLWCEACLVARVQGDIGYGRQLFPDLFGAAYVGGAIQNERAGQGFGFVRSSIALIADPWPLFRIRLGYEYRMPISSETANYGVVKAAARWSVNERMDIRLQYDHDEARQVNFGIGFYW